MSRGFSFNQDKCVNCGACSAACILYNAWDVKPRNVYVFNEKLLHTLPLVNISLACNHCEEPSCLEGCPTGAYSKNEETGVVIIDEEKCLGCRYCEWTCPYDAPKFSTRKKIIEKCNLCSTLEDDPACADACPTGALSYCDISSQMRRAPDWFLPDNIGPALEFTGTLEAEPLEIVPSGKFSTPELVPATGKISGEWSLVIFSFLTTVAVSISSASLMKGEFPGLNLLILLFSAAIISLFHPGKPLRTWRSLSNPAKSPLSREIYAFILFLSLSAGAILLSSPGLLLAASVEGLILLIIIDSVYFKPDKKAIYHSGQTFISSLLLISYFTGSILPFTFITIIKVILSARKFSGKDHEAFRFLSSSILLLVSAGLVSGYAGKSVFLTAIVLSTELIERYLFYIDFRPENIKYKIDKKIKSQYYETKRG